MGEEAASWSMVAEFSNHPEAELARNLLAKHGIRAVVWSDDCGGLAGGQTFVQGVRVFVPDSDRQAALAILGKSVGGTQDPDAGGHGGPATLPGGSST